MNYKYLEEMKNDVREVLADYPMEQDETMEAYEERLNNALWIDDGVTGNGSGSYTFDSVKAAEYVGSNYVLLLEALQEFGTDKLPQPEEADVIIRCYLLGRAIHEVLNESGIK